MPKQQSSKRIKPSRCDTSEKDSVPMSTFEKEGYEAAMTTAIEYYLQKEVYENDVPISSTVLSLKEILAPSKKHHKKGKTKASPPRPQNDYVLYRKEFQAARLQKDPDVTFALISKESSKSWKKESPLTKNFFQILARVSALAHHEVFPNYRYKPKSAGSSRRDEETKPWMKNEHVFMPGRSESAATTEQPTFGVEETTVKDPAEQDSSCSLTQTRWTAPITSIPTTRHRRRNLTITKNRIKPNDKSVKQDDQNSDTFIELFSRDMSYPTEDNLLFLSTADQSPSLFSFDGQQFSTADTKVDMMPLQTDDFSLFKQYSDQGSGSGFCLQEIFENLELNAASLNDFNLNLPTPQPVNSKEQSFHSQLQILENPSFVNLNRNFDSVSIFNNNAPSTYNNETGSLFNHELDSFQPSSPVPSQIACSLDTNNSVYSYSNPLAGFNDSSTEYNSQLEGYFQKYPQFLLPTVSEKALYQSNVSGSNNASSWSQYDPSYTEAY
ncbi:hypothetical protein G9A89_015830 [Geosiphon pyriformis]|nr:hypothetical protein G9A89_015830 [Geosiphon pyriformis]